jgi:hypothetical protein
MRYRSRSPWPQRSAYRCGDRVLIGIPRVRDQRTPSKWSYERPRQRSAPGAGGGPSNSTRKAISGLEWIRPPCSPSDTPSPKPTMELVPAARATPTPLQGRRGKAVNTRALSSTVTVESAAVPASSRGRSGTSATPNPSAVRRR